MCRRTTTRTAATPRHVVQRRNGDSPSFFADEDYLVYLDCLQEAAVRHRCAIHSYVLMPDHVQLLVSLDMEQRLARMMRCVNGRYVEYVKYVYQQRNGDFWKHGLESTAVDSERRLLDCYRSIESAPVQACLVSRPADYRWSSYNHHAHGCEDSVIQDHPSYLKLGATQDQRRLAYHELFPQPSAGREEPESRMSVNRSLAAGGEGVKDQIERLVRRVRPRDTKRPARTEYATAA
jgi:putative transposase